jgi:hypothetical protein
MNENFFITLGPGRPEQGCHRCRRYRLWKIDPGMSPSSMQQTKLERLPLERFFQVGQLFASKAGDYPYSGTLN